MKFTFREVTSVGIGNFCWIAFLLFREDIQDNIIESSLHPVYYASLHNARKYLTRAKPRLSRVSRRCIA